MGDQTTHINPPNNSNLRMDSGRPCYETTGTLQDEMSFQEWFALRNNLHIKKMPRAYGIDFAVYNQNHILMGFVEYKTRNHTMDQLRQWGGYKLSVHKFMRMVEMTEQTGRQACLFIQTKELPNTHYWRFKVESGQLALFPIQDWEPYKGGVAVSGRKREQIDPQDTEPAVLIPCDYFQLQTL